MRMLGARRSQARLLARIGERPGTLEREPPATTWFRARFLSGEAAGC